MSEVWTIRRVLDWTLARFAERGKATPRLDAEILLAHVLSQSRVFLYTHFDQPLSADELAAFRALIKRRLDGHAVAYLVGKKEFRSLDLFVDERVLIPRPDTETLIDVAIDRFVEAPHTIVDVGTGSGAIALALKKKWPTARVIAVDTSVVALEVARLNSERLSLPIECLHSDLLASISDRVDLIVSNPPYIPTGEIAKLSPEVQREPHAALDGGKDGLEILRRLSAEAPAKLLPGGVLAVELGAGQSAEVVERFTEQGFVDIVVTKDLGGVERVVSSVRPR